MKNSHLEIKFKIWLEQNKLLAYFSEQVPILKPSRLWKSEKPSWRIDFLSEELKIAVEIQGGTFSYGGHSRGAGQHSDFDKINHLQNLGYKVFQFDTQHVRENDYIELLEAYKILLNTNKKLKDEYNKAKAEELKKRIRENIDVFKRLADK